VHHVAEALLALGGAFLVCGLVARAGVPIGLPTIPLFMLAGLLLGPNTPGSSWSVTRRTSRWSPASAWCSSCSTWAWSSPSAS
jgi:Kef-type K+ transport system membrane component KefB